MARQITKGLPRTADGARAAIWRYEQNNKDLDANTCRLMALAACGRYFGRRILEEAHGGPLPNLPFREWSWRYWTALQLSGLEHCWEEFVKLATTDTVRVAAVWLRDRTPREQYNLFLKRLGTDPHNSHRKGTKYKVWTKSSVWDLRSNMAKILVGKQHLPGRPITKPWQLRLGDKGIYLLENELMHLYNVDMQPAYEIKQHAVEYVRRRLGQLLGLQRPMGYWAAAWFFQEQVLDPAGSVLVPRQGGRVVLEMRQGLRGLQKRYSW